MTCKYDQKTKSIVAISNNDNLKEKLIYQGICYWWFMDRWLYDSVNPNMISSLSKYQKILLFNQKYFQHVFLPIELGAHLLSKTLTCNQKRKQDYLNNQSNQKYIVMHSLINQWRIDSSVNDNKKRLINSYYQDIIHKLPNDIVPVMLSSDIYDAVSMISHIKKLCSVSKSSNEDINVLIRYWSVKIWIEEIQSRKYFKNIWNFLKNDKVWFQKLSICTGVEIVHLKSLIEYYLLCIIPRWVTHNLLLEKYITDIKPSVIVISHEQTFSGRSLIFLGKKHHIPTIGIQHGIIPEFHSGYLYHTQAEMPTDPLDDALSYPLPDMTLVWGEHDYNILRDKGYYPKDKILITGNQRYDNIITANEKYSRAEFCNKYNIDSATKIILWTTQSHGWSMEENISYFEEIFNAISKINSLTLIIKQHPNETIIHRNLIQNFMDKFNHIHVIVPPKEADTTELIFISDLTILKNSTSGQEAVIFHKPLIVLDFSNNPDSVYYVKEGVAVGVYEHGELKNILYYCLNSNPITTEKQDAYIRKYMYKIDGCAAKRCTDIIQAHLYHY